MEYSLYRDVDGLDTKAWENLTQNSPFSQKHYLKVLENTFASEIPQWHLLISKDRKPLSCSSFHIRNVELKCLAPIFLRKTPFLKNKKIKVLYCGLPIGLCENFHFHLAPNLNPKETNEIFEKNYLVMNDLAQKEGCQILSTGTMILDEIAPEIPKALKEKKFHQGKGAPLVYIDVKWPSFEDYLASFRSSYRRKISNDIKLSEKNQVIWEKCKLSDLDLGEIFPLYENVYNRSKFKIEFYSQAFFMKLTEYYNDKCSIIIGKLQNKIVAYALLIKNKGAIHLEVVGLNYNYVVPLGIYRNLMIQIVRFAIESQFKTIQLGPNSYHLKQRLGGKLKPISYFFKYVDPGKNYFIGKMMPIVFPKFNPDLLHVFSQDKKEEQDEEKLSKSFNKIPQ